MNFIYGSDGNAIQCDSYVKASSGKSMYEDHWMKSGTAPSNFKGVLELRTEWYTPNDEADTSYDVNGYNETTCSVGQEFRTYVKSNGIYGGYNLGLNYEN